MSRLGNLALVFFLCAFVSAPSRATSLEECRKAVSSLARLSKGVAGAVVKPFDWALLKKPVQGERPTYHIPQYFPRDHEGNPDYRPVNWALGIPRVTGQTIRQTLHGVFDTLDGNFAIRALTWNRRVPRFHTAFGIAIGTSLLTQKGWAKASEWKIRNQIEENPAPYDLRVAIDPRFSAIRVARDRGDVSGPDARYLAYRLLEGEGGIKQYLETLRPRFKLVKAREGGVGKEHWTISPPLTDRARGELLESALFRDPQLQGVLSTGVIPLEAFDTDPNDLGPLSLEKVDGLITSQMLLFDRIHILYEEFGDTAAFQAMEAHPQVQEFIREALGGEYLDAIRERRRELRDAGKKDFVTDEEMQALVLDNEFNKSKFEIWDILGYRPKPELGDADGDGRHTLVDEQTQRLIHLRDRKRDK